MKKGNLMFGVMWFVFAFIIAVLLTAPLRDMVDVARDGGHLNCAGNNITTGIAMTCVAVDLTIPFFIIAVILAGAVLIRIRSN